MEMDLISIIVPAYNVEKYIDRCIASIINQSYFDLEIIIVDDGSTDNTGKICDCWKEKDSRINVVHQKNTGLSGARNTGLGLARGSYIMFVDSDDAIARQMVQFLYDAICKTGCRISACSYTSINETEFEKYQGPEDIDYRVYQYSIEEALNNISKISMQVWNKMYASEIVRGMRFKGGILYEDIAYTIEAFIRCDRLCYIDYAGYLYTLERLGSTVSSFSNRRVAGIDEFINGIKKLKDLGYTNLNEMCRIAEGFYIRNYFDAKEQHLQRKLLNKIHSNYKAVANVNSAPKAPYSIIFNISPSLAYYLRKIKRKIRG